MDSYQSMEEYKKAYYPKRHQAEADSITDIGFTKTHTNRSNLNKSHKRAIKAILEKTAEN